MKNYESPDVEYVSLAAVKKLDDLVDWLPYENDDFAEGLSDNTVFN